MTNTTTTGELDITDDYLFLIGKKINFINLLPKFYFGYSHTPSHKESKYYKWENKDIYDIALSNEHQKR